MNDELSQLPAYIMAGGKSSRFNSDKARALIGGRPLISIISEKLETLFVSVTAVADKPDKYADLGLTTIGDLTPGLGPLGGLATALDDFTKKKSGTGWIFLISCDFVDFETGWIERLWSEKDKKTKAAAFRGDFWEPLFAFYHTSLFAEAHKRAASNDRSMWRFLEKVKCYPASLPQGWFDVADIDRPEDLEKRKKKTGGK